MNAIVQAALATSLADLEVTSSLPSTPYGYGCDVSCAGDVDPRWNEVSDDALVLAQHCARRLDTPSGLPDDDTWGLSLGDYVNRPTTRRELDALEGEIIGELLDDDRVEEVRAAVEASADCSILIVTLRVVPADPLVGDFTLTLSVSNAGLLIEEMTR